MRVIGMMSGTSHDAIDAVAADLTAEGDTLVLSPLGMLSEPYRPELRSAIVDALPPRATTMEAVCRLDTEIGQAFAALAERANTELCEDRAEVIVSHGQTTFHWVQDHVVRGTLQLGQPAWIAERTGCTVVSDLRSRDVAAGGHGAPMVSAFDVLWLGARPGTSVALNLGGIANITVVGGQEPIAYDTGPANALIDAAVKQLTGGEQSFDRGGAMARRGNLDESLLQALLADPYYGLPAPKSTGKELFHDQYLQRHLAGFGEISPDDLIATLTELTARTVADAITKAGATEVIASGGGTMNPALMSALENRIAPVPLLTAEDLGLSSSSKEAYAFAVLGYHTMIGLPATVPSCTGARHASILGTITPGRRGVQRPDGPQRTLTALNIRG
ncbi:anhydro-N-acetylmuramic acid kinase [Nakamurella sp. GG22]